MTNTEINKGIVDALLDQGALDYGSTITQEELQQMFNLSPLTDEEAKELSLKEIKQRMDSDQLTELGVADIIRKKLIDKGRYFKGSGTAYRVCLPSENVHIADNMMASADRKMKKASTLLANTPDEVYTDEEAQKASKLSTKSLLHDYKKDTTSRPWSI